MIKQPKDLVMAYCVTPTAEKKHITNFWAVPFDFHKAESPYNLKSDLFKVFIASFSSNPFLPAHINSSSNEYFPKWL